MMMKNRYLWVFLSFLLMVGCESLEDTYSDYAGDGPVRYLGMCGDISVSPGWERLIVEWSNSVDPVIDKIKVSWTKDGVTRDSLLDRTQDSCNITGLEEGVYEITVCSIGKNGEQSLSSPLFARPYTYSHESVIGFTRLISKHFFVENHLILFFTEWQDNVTLAELKYYKKGEDTPTVYTLTKERVEQKYVMLPDEIDLTHPVTLKREGRLDGCTDLIPFNPEELADEGLYTSDFKAWMQVKYGQSEITQKFVDTLSVLEIDYSIRSIEDILNFPNLKKLVLGKNRYMTSSFNFAPEDFSQLEELEKGYFVLEVAHQLRKLEIERYADHFLDWHYYLPENLKDVIQEMGFPTLPQLNYLDASTWIKSCNQTDEGRLSNVNYLFDKFPMSYWQLLAHTTSLTYEIEVDMNELREIKGVTVQQRSYRDTDNPQDLPDWIQIQVSTDKILWQNATWAEANTLGTTSGETTLINFSKTWNVRYVKFIFTDPPSEVTFQASLAELGIF